MDDWQTPWDREACARLSWLIRSGVSPALALALCSFSWELEEAMRRHPASGTEEP